MKYPKTENLFKRDPDTHKLTDELRRPDFGMIKEWLVTEKIDGMNIRIVDRPVFGPLPSLSLDVVGHETLFYGRTDNAIIPGPLTDFLRAHFKDVTCWVELRELLNIPEYLTITVFGEGYGGKIQKGSGYRPEQSLRIFDICTHGEDARPYWRPWAEVEQAASIFGIDTVPVVSSKHTLQTIIDIVCEGGESQAAKDDGGTGCQAEGIVARTDPYLLTTRGELVKFKLKTKDFG